MSSTLSSCYFNPSMMLKTKRDYQFSSFPKESNQEYVISPNDRLTFRLLYNDGFKLIDLSSGGQGGNVLRQNQSSTYLVEFDGKTKLPLLRRTQIAGKTIRQAELMLEELYSAYYVKPFVILKVTNRRVMIFPGSSGSAKTISLQNESTTLLEALALAGGIPSTGRSKKIKVIRKSASSKTGNEVLLIDLSNIDGLKQGELILQGGDMIYIDPIPNIAEQALRNLNPFVSLLSTILLIITLTGLGN
ncbi:MAG: polysaccharide biosynthesis/export family protein [Flavobacteriales bacterium]|nr:polysaccharide biosynthesis/export family protein [Flavobacteriales bacterium]